MLIHLREYCRRQRQELLLSGVDTRETDNAFLKSIGNLDIFTEPAHFVYLSDAIEAAEESLLDSIVGESRYTRELGFHELAFRFLAGMATDLSDRIGQSVTSIPALHI